MENDRFGLGGKVALVTGAGRGFGRAFSLALAEAGADVVCVEKVKETLGENSRACQADRAESFATRC